MKRKVSRILYSIKKRQGKRGDDRHAGRRSLVEETIETNAESEGRESPLIDEG